MRFGRYVSTLSVLLFAGQALARDAVARDTNVRQLVERSEVEARQLLEPTAESLKAAASDMYDDLKELEGEVADKAEAYLEEMFPGIAHESEEQDEELAVEEAVDQEFLDDSKPLEHADETDTISEEITAEATPSIAKGGHHRNGTHHRRPGHKNKHKHNSTHGNDTETPVFEPERYFTEPLITGLLVTFLVFIPLIAMGIAALSSIQVPPYLMAVSKSAGVSQSKKEQ